MHAVVRRDPRAVALCIQWLKAGTVAADQSAALRHALTHLAREAKETDRAWVRWHEGGLFSKSGKSRFPEPELVRWLADLKKQGETQSVNKKSAVPYLRQPMRELVGESTRTFHALDSQSRCTLFAVIWVLSMKFIVRPEYRWLNTALVGAYVLAAFSQIVQALADTDVIFHLVLAALSATIALLISRIKPWTYVAIGFMNLCGVLGLLKQADSLSPLGFAGLLLVGASAWCAFFLRNQLLIQVQNEDPQPAK